MCKRRRKCSELEQSSSTQGLRIQVCEWEKASANATGNNFVEVRFVLL